MTNRWSSAVQSAVPPAVVLTVVGERFYNANLVFLEKDTYLNTLKFQRFQAVDLVLKTSVHVKKGAKNVIKVAPRMLRLARQNANFATFVQQMMCESSKSTNFAVRNTASAVRDTAKN